MMDENLNQGAWQLAIEAEVELDLELQLVEEHRHQCLCDAKSYIYFLISIMLMISGLVLTILGVLSFASNDYITFEGRGHQVQPLVFLMLLVGPILINVAAIVAVKNIVYLRRKSLELFNSRRRAQILVSLFLRH